MSKPLGIGLGIDNGGNPRLFVRPSDRAIDLIWDAVREAINANMLPEQFRTEASQAWKYYLEEDIKYAQEQLSKK